MTSATLSKTYKFNNLTDYYNYTISNLWKDIYSLDLKQEQMIDKYKQLREIIISYMKHIENKNEDYRNMLDLLGIKTKEDEDCLKESMLKLFEIKSEVNLIEDELRKENEANKVWFIEYEVIEDYLNIDYEKSYCEEMLEEINKKLSKEEDDDKCRKDSMSKHKQ